MKKDSIWLCENLIDEGFKQLAKKANISNFLAKIFLSRGITNTEEIENFLKPSLNGLLNPYLLKDMEKAVHKIIDSVKNNAKILIYGDYDVDGITSTSILFDFIKNIGGDVRYYIPDRITEGYGLPMGTVEKIIDVETSLLITVDCGITSIEEVEFLNKNKVDVIITDHHKCSGKIPNAYAVINPCRPDCEYPFKHLAGVGVVFKLITAISKEIGFDSFKYLDIVAMGTIADVVPLLGENRIIVKEGLKRLKETNNIGLRILIEETGLKDKNISSTNVGFILAPRINAAGRMGNANLGVELLTTEVASKAKSIVEELNDKNSLRKEIEQNILAEAIQKIEENKQYDTNKVLVVAGENWHDGVIGIVASRITEKYYRPCVLIKLDGEKAKASARSIEGFDIYKALTECNDLLEKYGGHKLAAGLSLKKDNITEFTKKINNYADEILQNKDLIEKIKIDLEINKEDINETNVHELESLEPCGCGNERPIFLYSDINIRSLKTVGNDKHVKMELNDGEYTVDAIGFNLGHIAKEYIKDDSLDILCAMEINTWANISKIQLNIKKVKNSQKTNIKEFYYYTLDKCYNLENINRLANKEIIFSNGTEITSEEELIDILQTSLNNKETLGLIFNSLHSLNIMLEILKNSSINIKKSVIFCYTEFIDIKKNKINILVNPNLDEIKNLDLDKAFCCGEWLDLSCLHNFSVGRKEIKKYFYKIRRFKNDIIDIVPTRNDLVIFYKYLKEVKCFSSEDLFYHSKKIIKMFKINMNYFKIRRCIEIFDELDIIDIKYKNLNCFTIALNENKSEKKKLEHSNTYNNMQRLISFN